MADRPNADPGWRPRPGHPEPALLPGGGRHADDLTIEVMPLLGRLCGPATKAGTHRLAPTLRAVDLCSALVTAGRRLPE